MRVEVGKIYKCGGTFVKIIGEINETPIGFRYLGDSCPRYLGDIGFRYLGAEWDIKKGEFTKCPYAGRFSSSGSSYFCGNPKPFLHQLEEIEEQQEAVEMTISEISKALGKQIKIVKENS